VDATHSLPASVSVRDGDRYTPVPDATVQWADGSDALTVISFSAVRGTGLRLELTSRHPGEQRGAIRISRLETSAG
jgi:beta-galactosidase